MKSPTLASELHRAEFLGEPVRAADSLVLALHTSEPEGLDQTSNEVSLAGYRRVSVPRNTDFWAVEGFTTKNASLIRFPTITGGESKAEWLTIGIDGEIRRKIKLESPIELAQNRRVEFEPGDLEITDQ